ncbi:LLM class flavin-dependent oxidoreductase [Pseudochelatococcus contaminans]|uniref:FMN-dependent oxidoreductase (Nitrilotriacetate monooxygenase family) n=1 Tax=Pseudochelatococcus contaminans TaxID=1538103 RepID=A0A7W5Z253_9HYPH|nr:LLM class flavin-dependent oxidoreductase [Pseudochelatococcus contaminans]MBB3808588.1 FMN-dependent oxidoreductase (nitrilotriacetate monooxygenase family) [Pseudochelatococcus contaminans]
MSERELHLNINILHSGFHVGAWRVPQSDPNAFIDVGHYVRTAQIAERGKLDAVFLADVPSFAERPEYRPYPALEPTIILATVAAHTSQIGVIGTASTSFNDPYNIARRFGSLDLASNGRAGWNIVTTADPGAARNFGLDAAIAHHERYERAAEFADVVTRLWDSWEDGALVADKASGRFVDVGRVHAIDHAGKHFQVRGPLNVPRSRQGRPVLVQAGGSEDGRELAARHAEAIFSVALTQEDALAFAADVTARAKALGRARGPLFLPGLATLIGSTEAEVKRREDELWDVFPLEFGLQRIAGTFQIDPARLSYDEPLPDDIEIPKDGGHTFAQATLAVARSEGLTVREILRRLGTGGGHRFIAATPEVLADDIEAWFLSGAADGFNLMPDVLPDGLEVFVDHVVPLLQRKGIFRTEYRGDTLRDHFGLSRTESALRR